jgi:hypothetical protein
MYRKPTLPTRQLVRASAASLFADQVLDTIMAVLDEYGIEPHEVDREGVQLAILKLSECDLDKLLHYIAAAKQDYRDVLYWSAYPEESG